jgi:hypothetical protein
MNLEIDLSTELQERNTVLWTSCFWFDESKEPIEHPVPGFLTCKTINKCVFFKVTEFVIITIAIKNKYSTKKVQENLCFFPWWLL